MTQHVVTRWYRPTSAQPRRAFDLRFSSLGFESGCRLVSSGGRSRVSWKATGHVLEYVGTLDRPNRVYWKRTVVTREEGNANRGTVRACGQVPTTRAHAHARRPLHRRRRHVERRLHPRRAPRPQASHARVLQPLSFESSALQSARLFSLEIIFSSVFGERSLSLWRRSSFGTHTHEHERRAPFSPFSPRMRGGGREKTLPDSYRGKKGPIGDTHRERERERLCR